VLFDYVDFTEVPGDSTGHDLMLFALSTCGFCKSAIAFLKEHSVQYTLAYIDRMPVQTKKRVKEEFSERFQTRMLYPTMIIDGKDTLIGFIEESWKKSLDLK
jgi:glutaredoxin-like protein NrdH